MNRIISLFFLSLTCITWGQSYAPAAGKSGSTAIHKDSSIFVDWANEIVVTRGWLNISNKSAGKATFGVPENALGKAKGGIGDVVSLGDSGVAVLNFQRPIINGPGFDFAVFENGFEDDYIELAFVEVSSDGVKFVRFPGVSETPTQTQQWNGGYTDCRYINNLAGKYRQGYGTPFDLEELKDSIGLDINKITHVKIVDVIGSVDNAYGSKDSKGNLINDPFPTEFESGGFDLEAIGVIHQEPLGIQEITSPVYIYPNPTKDILHIQVKGDMIVNLFDSTGKLLNKFSAKNHVELHLQDYSGSIFILEIESSKGILRQKVIRS